MKESSETTTFCQMNRNAQPLLLLGFVVAVFIAGFLWFDRPTIETIRVVEMRDTTYVSRIDTFYVEAEGGGDFESPTSAPRIAIAPTGDTLSTYHESYSDSLVDISVRVTVKGVLTDWGLRYTLHIPVVRVDSTIYIEHSVETTKTIKQWSLNLGVSALLRYDPLSPYFAVGPSVQLVFKNHRTISYAYLTGGSHLVTITTPLFTR